MSARVLLVEDHQVARRAASFTLSRLGCDVVCAERGSQAVDLVEEGEIFDLIVIDLGLPDIDGLDLIQKLRSLDDDIQQIPVVVLTANNDAYNRVRSETVGVADYLIKPLTEGVARRILSYCALPMLDEVS